MDVSLRPAPDIDPSRLSPPPGPLDRPAQATAQEALSFGAEPEDGAFGTAAGPESGEDIAVCIGGPLGTPVTPSKGEAAERVRELEADAPEADDYPGGSLNPLYWVATAQHRLDLHGAKQALLEAYKAEAAEGSPTTQAIFEAAEREGVQVVVLSDEEYAERYPGTGGVTVGETVYVPVSALESGEGVLEHELVHALLNGSDTLFDETVPLDDRVAEARELFESIGLDADDGERLIRSTEGMNPVDADHVQTYVTGIDIHREQAGLPPLTDAQRDTLYEQAAIRETALGVWRHGVEIGGEEVSLAGLGENDLEFAVKISQMSEQELADFAAEVEARWNETSLAGEYPLTGDTPLERLQEIRDLVLRLQDEAPLQQYWQ